MDRGPTFGCFFGHGRLEGANTWNLKKDLKLVQKQTCLVIRSILGSSACKVSRKILPGGEAERT